jgi:hypothetical protein
MPVEEVKRLPSEDILIESFQHAVFGGKKVRARSTKDQTYKCAACSCTKIEHNGKNLPIFLVMLISTRRSG